METYLDSCVILRVLFGAPGALDLEALQPAATSVLARVECLRTLDRNRILDGLSDEAYALRREAIFRMFEGIETVDLDPAILERVSLPSPVPLRTLDAIHLATALHWRESRGGGPAFATHDRELGLAARIHGFAVLGIRSGHDPRSVLLPGGGAPCPDLTS